MSRYHSLATKITIIFGIAFSVVCLLFLLLNRVQVQNNLEIMQHRQLQSINYLLWLYKNKTPPTDIEAFFNYFGLKIVSNKNLLSSVISTGEVIFTRETDLGSFSSLLYNDRYYLYLKNPASTIFLESQEGKNAGDSLWIAFVLALVLLISIYVSILKSIDPLKTLRQSIRKFAAGDLDVVCKIDKSDEIGEVANEFDKAVKKIKDLIKSRQLFLRTIMHELKTPIGKGRIVSEMIENDLQKKRLVDIFDRMNLLISEFAKIEQLVSGSYSLNKNEYPISLLVEHARDLLMLDEIQELEKISINLKNEDLSLLVDLDLMALAIKNLMDNAIKYSDDKKVIIESFDETLRVSNKGGELSQPIEYFLEPFVGTAKKDGLGLGLYIVKNILELHNFKIKYSYANGRHIFDINFKKEEFAKRT